MKRVLSFAIVAMMLTLNLHAQTAPDSGELTKLLKDFLDGASRNDAAMHDRFWADDLIYTGSAGRRTNKADILRNLRSAPPAKPEDPPTTYTAEDIRIQQYGSTAVVAFRLVITTKRAGKTEVANNLNTGTFLKRNGKWQAVSWQSTRMPRAEEEAKKEVSAIEAAFHQAMLAADAKRLESLIDESFVWTQSTGEQVTRQNLLEKFTKGELKYSKLETSNVTVFVYGDTAVVRGVSKRQPSPAPGSDDPGNTSPFTILYTLTFINKGGAWKAVAMHTSRT